MSLVLCYHSVSDEWDHQLAVTPAAFERQIRSLVRRGFRPVSAEQAMAARGRVFHVSFDDAYRDIAGALDLLESLGASATIFAATDFAEGGLPLAVPELVNEVSAHPARLATMDWDELRELVARGFEVGAHTVSHPHLPRLADDELDAELLDSRLRCEDELGVPCRYLAYPYGEHDERVRAAARRAGYTAAFALHADDPRDDPFAVPRVDFYRTDTRAVAAVKTTALRRPAYAAARRLRTLWPAPASYGHGWMVAVFPEDATRFRVADSAIAARLLAAGAELVDGDADIDVGTPSTLSGAAPMAIAVLAAPPHDAEGLTQRVARRLLNSMRIRVTASGARRAIRRLGYPYVEVIPWDVAQTFRRAGAPCPARRPLVERVPQRALVIGRRGSPRPTMLDAVLREARLSGASGFEAAAPTIRTGGVLILMTDAMVLRTALGPAGEQIESQLDALHALRSRKPEPIVSGRIAWPLGRGTRDFATWSVERRLAGTQPSTLTPELHSECVDFLIGLHRVRGPDDDHVSLADCAAVVAPYRPRAVADRLLALGERLDSTLAHMPRGFAHGDFFLGNLLVDDGSLTGVIDWDGGGPGALPLLDLLHLRHSDARPVPDVDWGRSVVDSLLPWAYRSVDPLTARYCSAAGFDPDSDTLEALVVAYWLDRLAYQLLTHRFRRSQQPWLVENVDHVLDALSAATDVARPEDHLVGRGA